MKAEVVSVTYYKPEIIISQRDHKKFRRLLSEGYYVALRPTGQYVLQKKSQIKIEFQSEDGTIECVNMRNLLKKHYGSQKKGRELYELIKADIKQGKIAFIKEESTGKISIV